MTTVRDILIDEVVCLTPDEPVERVLCRRSRSWPCPHPAVCSLLVVHELHDVTLHITGAFTGANVGAFTSCVRAVLLDRPRRLVVDMSSLDVVDSEGAEALLSARDAADRESVELVLDSPGAMVLGALGSEPFRLR